MKLTHLDLCSNNFSELPREIVNLIKLEFLWLQEKPHLIMISEQEEWIARLKEKECAVEFGRKVGVNMSELSILFNEEGNEYDRL